MWSPDTYFHDGQKTLITCMKATNLQTFTGSEGIVKSKILFSVRVTFSVKSCRFFFALKTCQLHWIIFISTFANVFKRR